MTDDHRTNDHRTGADRTDADRHVRGRFDAYRRGLVNEVRPPGTEAVHRTVLRRQRRRTAVVGIAAVLAAGLAAGQLLVDRRESNVPVTPVSPSPSAEASRHTGQSPSPDPSSAGPSSAPPSSSRPPSRTPSSAAPAEQVPPRRTFPVVDGAETHVVALPEVRLRPEGGRYRGVVYVDVYNSGRQPSREMFVYLTIPTGVDWDSLTDNPTKGGCGGAPPPETWTCPASPVPAGGGYRRMPFWLDVHIAPGSTTQSVDGFAVRVTGTDNAGKPVDLTPADNKAAVRLVLPPG